jgi:hypothetical protein
MFNSGQFTALYNEYLESGLSVRDFCANHHMRESKFYYWKNRLKRQLPPKKGFVPLVFENQQQVRPYHFSTSVQNQVKTFSNPASASHPVSCEISFPNGVSIKLSGMPDPEMLRSLLLLPHQ